jgi:hypothetical protein
MIQQTPEITPRRNFVFHLEKGTEVKNIPEIGIRKVLEA